MSIDPLLQLLRRQARHTHQELAELLSLSEEEVRSVRQLLKSPLRVPAIGALVFGGLLLRSQLNIGFRYALPLLPLFAVIVAAGTFRVTIDP